MARSTCPLCGRNFHDLLKHLVLAHDIENIDHFKIEIEKVEATKKTQSEFSNYVRELQDQRKKGTISAEDYRILVTKWLNQHQ